MELEHLKNKLDDLTADLLKEGILDVQFKQLEKLQVDIPGFVSDTVSLYLGETEKIINEMHGVLKHTEDFSKIDAHAIQLKGSSVSIGTKRIADACEAILKCCKENNHKECLAGYQKHRQEHCLLKTKIEPLLLLEKEIEALEESSKMLIMS